MAETKGLRKKETEDKAGNVGKDKVKGLVKHVSKIELYTKSYSLRMWQREWWYNSRNISRFQK